MRIIALVRVRDEVDLIPWCVANLTYASQIIFADSGSRDGTLDVIKDLSRHDKRLILSQWEGQSDPYHGEELWTGFALEQVPSQFDWLHLTDVDEVANVTFQKSIQSVLQTQSRDQIDTIAYRFLYLTPGWEQYYVEPSRWHMTSRLWSRLPRLLHAENGTQLEVPARVVTLPDEMCVYHWNWALEQRFERKRTWYSRRSQARGWHPDEKYPERVPLPGGAVWYSPAGWVVSASDLKSMFADRV